MRVIGTVYIEEIDRELYKAVLKKHTVLLNEEQNVIAKDCSSCGNMLTMDEYYLDRHNLFHKTFTCKSCRAIAGKKFRQSNPRYHKEYAVANKEHMQLAKRRWNKRNPDKLLRYARQGKQRRQQAMQQALPDDIEYMDYIYADKTCSLTGSTEGTELDHVLPVMKGTWGNNKGNLIWLYSKLNSSKSDSNIFCWLEEMVQERLDYLLPEGVEMTVQEFRDRMTAVLTEKASEKGMTLDQYRKEYEEEYYRE